jgi:hypothetical protein
MFSTKLLASATTIAQHLPHVMRKLVRVGSLVASKGNRIRITSTSSVHAAPPIHDRGRSAPHPQGASLGQVGHGVKFADSHSIEHRTLFKSGLPAVGWINRQLEANPRIRFGVCHLCD